MNWRKKKGNEMTWTKTKQQLDLNELEQNAFDRKYSFGSPLDLVE